MSASVAGLKMEALMAQPLLSRELVAARVVLTAPPSTWLTTREKSACSVSVRMRCAHSPTPPRPSPSTYIHCGSQWQSSRKAGCTTRFWQSASLSPGRQLVSLSAPRSMSDACRSGKAAATCAGSAQGQAQGQAQA